MADPSYNDLIGDEGFLEWFWQGTNGNNMIRFLNTNSREDKIIRERFSPFAYGLIFNGPISDTAKNSSQINDYHNVNAANISMLFVLMKSASDTTSHRDFERNIRINLGYLSRKVLP